MTYEKNRYGGRVDLEAGCQSRGRSARRRRSGEARSAGLGWSPGRCEGEMRGGAQEARPSEARAAPRFIPKGSFPRAAAAEVGVDLRCNRAEGDPVTHRQR